MKEAVSRYGINIFQLGFLMGKSRYKNLCALPSIRYFLCQFFKFFACNCFYPNDKSSYQYVIFSEVQNK